MPPKKRKQEEKPTPVVDPPEPEIVTDPEPEVVSSKIETEPPPKKKRAKNAFMYYSDNNRARVKTQFELNSVAEVAKKLGEEWRGLSEEDKKPYVDMSEKAKAELAAM